MNQGDRLTVEREWVSYHCDAESMRGDGAGRSDRAQRDERLAPGAEPPAPAYSKSLVRMPCVGCGSADCCAAYVCGAGTAPAAAAAPGAVGGCAGGGDCVVPGCYQY